MNVEQITKAVDEDLSQYPEILNRDNVAKILGCVYEYVPVRLKELGIPTLEDSGKSFARMKISKAIMKQALIEIYTKNTPKAQETTTEVVEETTTEVVEETTTEVVEETTTEAVEETTTEAVEETKEYSDTLMCQVCHKPVYKSPIGWVCDDGHSGTVIERTTENTEV